VVERREYFVWLLSDGIRECTLDLSCRVLSYRVMPYNVHRPQFVMTCLSTTNRNVMFQNTTPKPYRYTSPFVFLYFCDLNVQDKRIRKSVHTTTCALKKIWSILKLWIKRLKALVFTLSVSLELDMYLIYELSLSSIISFAKSLGKADDRWRKSV
jgi:hypothetical protein